MHWLRFDSGRVAASVALLLLAACTPPVRQFDLNNRPLSCEQANQYAYRTLQSMGFQLTGFEPAASGKPGQMHGTRRTDTGLQDVTVSINCHPGGGTDINASEDGSLLGQLELKRGFYMSFTGVIAAAEATASKEQAELARSFDQKKSKGLQVLLTPVRGLGSKLDFNLDLAAGGVLPVLVTINNVTTRAYKVDANDVVLMQKDGTRVSSLAVQDAAQRVATALAQQAKDDHAAPDLNNVTQRLQSRVFTSRSVPPRQSVKGYLFFPLGQYAKGRVVLEDVENEESEGFVVEF
jgi:hypothetical protein